MGRDLWNSRSLEVNEQTCEPVEPIRDDVDVPQGITEGFRALQLERTKVWAHPHTSI
jgi:hypothetical protein